jgi:SUMO ligase MMS21 Smc5/6 complex component
MVALHCLTLSFEMDQTWSNIDSRPVCVKEKAICEAKTYEDKVIHD